MGLETAFVRAFQPALHQKLHLDASSLEATALRVSFNKYNNACRPGHELIVNIVFHTAVITQFSFSF